GRRGDADGLTRGMRTMPRLGGWLRTLAGLLCTLLAASAPAQQPDPELEQVRDKLAKSLPDVQRQNIVRSPAPGLYEIHQAHAFGYVTADGRYLVSG
ncbi:disulfide isomerase DsbC N-terminal domain-containing protein, partial [Aeromonas hydrophila]|uniref:disulfide isomerase DsbC N-terminal domain-containing protein n=1 Tax=Aeromonas hydrophila TaxID=644 RepID=UPI00214E380E